MIGQTFSFSPCISTLSIWCCRVCYFSWWAQVLWGHHEASFFIENMGAIKQLCLRLPKSLTCHWPRPLLKLGQRSLLWTNLKITGIWIRKN